jgi:DNA-binding IclR family transcriptional regulator
VEHIIMPIDRLARPSTTQTPSTSGIPAILQQIQREYHEMPGLRLTQAQAQRLWDLDRTTCSTVLAMLTERGFLKRTPAGIYIRAWDEY